MLNKMLLLCGGNEASNLFLMLAYQLSKVCCLKATPEDHSIIVNRSKAMNFLKLHHSYNYVR